METVLKVDTWVVFDLEIGIIKEIREGGCATFSNGSTQISGRLFNRLRPLTLHNKTIVEAFKHSYDELHRMDGQAGFNFPDIHEHFSALALSAIDNPADVTKYYDLAREFVKDARKYKPTIQNIRLFRRTS